MDWEENKRSMYVYKLTASPAPYEKKNRDIKFREPRKKRNPEVLFTKQRSTWRELGNKEKKEERNKPREIGHFYKSFLAGGRETSLDCVAC